MSYVTSLLLHMGVLEREEERLKEVNTYFEPLYHGKGFVSIEDESLPHGWYGGTKYLQCNLFLSVGAFNYLNLDELVAHLKTITWDAPEDLQLLIRDEHDTNFRIINIFADGMLYTPERIDESQRLLSQADFLLAEASKGNLTREEIRDWRRKYRELLGMEEEIDDEQAVEGSARVLGE